MIRSALLVATGLVIGVVIALSLKPKGPGAMRAVEPARAAVAPVPTAPEETASSSGTDVNPVQPAPASPAPSRSTPRRPRAVPTTPVASTAPVSVRPSTARPAPQSGGIRFERAVTARAIGNREPRGVSTVFQSDQPQIYLFLEANNPGPEVARLHVFFTGPDGETLPAIAVRIPVAPRWRTWAFTRRANLPGAWTAQVRDRRGRVLATRRFRVVAAEPDAPPTGLARSAQSESEGTPSGSTDGSSPSEGPVGPLAQARVHAAAVLADPELTSTIAER